MRPPDAKRRPGKGGVRSVLLAGGNGSHGNTAAAESPACRPPRQRTVLHVAVPEDRDYLDELAAMGLSTTGLCGHRGVPMRPPFPPHAVVCLECAMARFAEARA